LLATHSDGVTMNLICRVQVLLLFAVLLAGVEPAIASAQPQVIISEASYTMGDGETPTFAEAMVLQKAKQMALEQAGTYVESYSKTQNLDLTTEEIQTITGGVLQTEVLKKSRTVVGDGVRFDLKIKATVTTDKMEELAQQVRAKDVAGEYKKLRDQYALLTKEIEILKQEIARRPQGAEREAALEKIREYEKAFGTVQKDEGALFQRLVRGDALVAEALNGRAIVEELVKTIIREGQIIELGEPKVHPSTDKSGLFKVIVPVNLRISDTLIPLMSKVVLKLNGTIRPGVDIDTADPPGRNMFRVGTENVSSVRGTLLRVAKDYETATYFQSLLRRTALQLSFTTSLGQEEVCEVELVSELITEGSNNRLVPVMRVLSRSDGRFGVDYAKETYRYIDIYALKQTQDQIDDQYRNDPGAGFVLILHLRAHFHVRSYLPEEIVRDLQKITAHIALAGTNAKTSR